MIPDIKKNIEKLKTLSGYDDATENLEVMSHISIFLTGKMCNMYLDLLWYIFVAYLLKLL